MFSKNRVCSCNLYAFFCKYKNAQLPSYGMTWMKHSLQSNQGQAISSSLKVRQNQKIAQART